MNEFLARLAEFGFMAGAAYAALRVGLLGLEKRLQESVAAIHKRIDDLVERVNHG